MGTKKKNASKEQKTETKTVTVKRATTNPDGLSITRNGAKFIFSWKIKDANHGAGQEVQYRINKDDWHTMADVGRTATSKTLEITPANYYPNTNKKLTTISFRVRGCRSNYSVVKKNKAGVVKKTTNYEMSWSERVTKVYTLSVPDTPKLSAALDTTYYNKSTFSWTTKNADNASSHYFTGIKWETMLIEDGGKKGADQKWKSTRPGYATNATLAGASSSKSITETGSELVNKSQSRFFRAKAVGPAGDSDAWDYAYHIYAQPLQAYIKSAVVENNTASGYQCTVKWTASTDSNSYPIDKVTLQYVITTAGAGLACPSGASWQDVVVAKDTKSEDAASFAVDNTLDPDECLYVRVLTQHDPYETSLAYSAVKRAKTGRLTAPSDLTVTPGSNDTATVEAVNGSAVPDSYLVVEAKRGSGSYGRVGTISAGSSQTTITIPSGSGTYKIRVYAEAKDSNNATATSEPLEWSSGSLPQAPASLTLTNMGGGKVLVEWPWTWTAATKAEISWADREDAWESTEAPKSSTVDHKATSWYIEGLDLGVTWYVRVRLVGDSDTSAWTSVKSINLSSKPQAPPVKVSQVVVTKDSTVTVSWTYATDDGFAQESAEIRLMDASGNLLDNNVLARAESAQAAVIDVEAAGWLPENTYYIGVRVKSSSGQFSDWSSPVMIEVAEEVEATITQHSLAEVTVVEDSDLGTTRTVTALTALPLTVTVTGAGSGITAVSIERAASYLMERPDGMDASGYEGEVVALIRQEGEAQISISKDDLIGRLDDGAKYRIVATVQDELGQSDEASVDFEVHWSHQALMPSMTETLDEENLVTMITPAAPTGTLTGDTFDLYRLSTDKPELIVKDGDWNTVYVDPFPAIGEFGGHRIVFKTVDGDYITEDNQPAWTDVNVFDNGMVELQATIINFENDLIVLDQNLEVSNTWEKDFKETKYLGGSVQGDWNPAVSRKASVRAVVVIRDDPDLVQTMRRLAVYPGICHVRTPEGSSYAADVQVGENVGYTKAGKHAEFSLTITRVDPEGLDGMTLAEWQEGE